MIHQSNPPWPVVLTINEFDPSAGGGIVADLKTFAAHKCYGVSTITALTVQNSTGATRLFPVKPSVLEYSIRALLADGRIKAVKIGMVASQANARVVRQILNANPELPAVLDPVMRPASETELPDARGFECLKEHLLSRVSVVTPNLAEAAALTGLRVDDEESMKAAARKLVEMGARAAFVTGGHLRKAIDVFFDGLELESFVGDHIKPDNTYGTGCTISSAVAANLALGRQLRDAVVLGRAFVREAIRKAFPIGPGRVPLNHLHRMLYSAHFGAAR
ncbi:MAG TPA: bifunctional hydroxymethylpyrimidine kinase/phosphomethylpyrimidine kinase [Candidatus Bathyarchaeia archaeon]|jgi:hydroxymethylpyrimidine kinase/phosphomethylpyrimidine kinase|nr:bifunctional hydroxymethylpyrimidine kinase/phosphomethylpyrimidine kinase [Candidatus Bathyarchaeia archaeon]